MPTLKNEDWMFDCLLESASERTVRIARLYECAREVTVWPENSISLGQHIMLLTHPELITPLLGFCITRPGGSHDWLRVPFFKLPSAIRDQLDKLYDSHLSALVDPSQPLHDMPFLPAGPGPPYGTSNQKVQLHIPLVGGDQFRRECFDAFLRQRFPQEEQPPGEGARAEIRLLKADLRYLGALRLLRCMTTREAIQHTARTLGQPLYANPSDWSRAKGKAGKIIKCFEDELRPIKELFAQAPNNITCAHYDPAKGKLQYG
jgi:hypothetical protein